MIFRRAIKTVLVVSGILAFCVVGKVIEWCVGDPKYRARAQSFWVSILSRWSLWVLGIKVSTPKSDPSSAPALIVANHMSYVDILIIASRYPAIFVTSEEVAEDPLLGMITRAAGCIYVERRHPFRLPHEIRAMRERLEAGVSVAFFPEGTTTDGKSILKFKSPLYQASVGLPDVKVKTLCLVYTHANGVELNDHLANQIFYYGDMTFAEQFKKLLSLDSVDVNLEEVAELEVQSRKLAAHSTRRKILEGYFSISRLATACSTIEYGPKYFGS